MRLNKGIKTKPKKKSDSSWMKCCRYCKHFSHDKCYCDEMFGGSDFADENEVFDDGYVCINDPDTFCCNAWM